MCSLIQALRISECSFSQLQAPTSSALLVAVTKTIGRYYPKDIANVVSALGCMGFSFQKMPSALQSELITTIHRNAPKKSCWDIVQTILGLANLKIPSKLFQQTSLTYYLASKSNLLGPSPTAHLILGMGLLSRDKVQFDDEILVLMQILCRKWCRKMVAKDFMISCQGIAYLSRQFQQEPPKLTLESIAAPFMLNISLINKNDKIFSRNLLKVPLELKNVLLTKNATILRRYFLGFSRHGVYWKLLMRIPELKLTVEESMSDIFIEEHTFVEFLRACVAMRVDWDDLSPSIQEVLLNTSSIVIKRILTGGDSQALVETIWSLGCIRVPINLESSAVLQLFKSAGEEKLLMALFGLGGMGYKVQSSYDSVAQEALESSLEECLTSKNFDFVIFALSKLSMQWSSLGPSLRRSVIEHMETMAPQGVNFPVTIRCLFQTGVLNEVHVDVGDSLISKISESADNYDSGDLYLLLQALPSIKTSNAFEKLYLGRRLFSNVINRLSDDTKLQASICFIDVLVAFSNLLEVLDQQLSLTEEDIEIVSLINVGLEGVKIINLNAVISILLSLKSIGFRWEDLAPQPRNKIQDAIKIAWLSSSTTDREVTRNIVQSIDAWDIELPDEPDSIALFDDLNDVEKDSLDSIRVALNSTVLSSMPEVLFKCCNMKMDLSRLKALGIWNTIESSLIKSNGSINDWKSINIKVPLLLNCFEKLQIKHSDISDAAKISLGSLLVTALPSMPARSVSNIMYYTARLKWPLTADLMREARASFFRTSRYMKGEGEFANALWAMTHMSCTWINLSEKETQGLCVAFTKLLPVINSRDLATAIGALKTMRARWSYLTEDLRAAILDRTADLIQDMDGTSISLLLYSFGEMDLKWSDIPIVARAVAQEALLKHTLGLSTKEMYYVVVGLGKLETSMVAFNPMVVQLLVRQAGRYMFSSALNPDGLIILCRSLARLGCIWTEIESALPPPAHELINSRLSSFHQSQHLRFMKCLYSLNVTWSALHPSTIELLLSGIGKDNWLRRKNNLLSTLQTFVKCQFSVDYGSYFFRSRLLEDILRCMKDMGGSEYLELICSLQKIGLSKSHFPSKHYAAISQKIALVSSEENSTMLLKAVKAVKTMRFEWSDIDAPCQRVLASTALKYYSINKDNRLLLTLTSMGATIASSSLQLDMHKKALSDGTLVNIKLVETLNKRLPSLTDEDLLRVIYLLGRCSF